MNFDVQENCYMCQYIKWHITYKMKGLALPFHIKSFCVLIRRESWYFKSKEIE